MTDQDSRSGRGDPDLLVTLEVFQGGDMFYLSDGGYSRVFCNYRGELLLTSNSSEHVKARWHDHSAQTIILRIEQRVEKWQLENNCKV